jgi:hypothetical protein
MALPDDGFSKKPKHVAIIINTKEDVFE